MKSKILKLLSIAALLCFMSFPAVSYGQSHAGTECVHGSYEISPRADVTYLVHRTVNGVKQHRLWNETKGKYDTLWVSCNC